MLRVRLERSELRLESQTESTSGLSQNNTDS